MEYKISFSNLVLEKREDGLYTYYPPEIEQIESNNYNSMDVFFYHRDVLSENGYYALKGVAFKQGLDSKNSELYIEVDMDDNSSHTFKATLLPDYWYNRISGSDLYTLSGFIAYFLYTNAGYVIVSPLEYLNCKYISGLSIGFLSIYI